MNNGIEIRWHGRGGQGAKTAALLLSGCGRKTSGTTTIISISDMRKVNTAKRRLIERWAFSYAQI